MAKRKIYVLHEFGARSHYLALEHLARTHGDSVVFAEFNIASQFKCCVRNFAKIPVLLRNIFTLSFLRFSTGKKVVVGIAPLSRSLTRIVRLTKGHTVYYHTSHVCWDGSCWPHPDTGMTEIWKSFTNDYASHIFAVSGKTKSEMVGNGFAKEGKISVVYHSIGKEIDVAATNAHNSFIYSGRLTEEKGIRQLLEYFQAHPEASITFVGGGNLKSEVEDSSAKYCNISYAGYIGDKEELFKLYGRHAFLVLNSMRTSRWEELFGISVIEGMNCGCVPVVVNHSGPLEIVTDSRDGIVFKEGDVAAALDKAMSCTDEEYSALRHNAVERGRQFIVSDIAGRWSPIYENF